MDGLGVKCMQQLEQEFDYDKADGIEIFEGSCPSRLRVRPKYSFVYPFLGLDYKSEFSSHVKPEGLYTQGCKWAPDGSCLLVATNDKQLRIFNLPENVAKGEFCDEEWITVGWQKCTKSAVTVKEANNIYDYQWNPSMHSLDQKSSFFAVSCRDLPIHIWDAWTGKHLSTYLHFNHLDELISAVSLAFSLDGLKLVGGYAKEIRVFDVERPGKDSMAILSEGQSGIFSSIAFHPKLSKIFAVGSYDSSVGLYSLETGKAFAILQGHKKGVTHIRFTNDGTKLFTGTRKDDDIFCWDIRNPGEVLAVLKRHQTTNQKMYFDITPFGDHYLLSGTTDGQVLVYDIAESAEFKPKDEWGETIPSSTFKAHTDCVNGISIHPFCPILATSSGQRIVPPIEIATDSDDEKDLSLETNKINNEVSVKLWWIGNN